jgi:hypothetical protein
MQALRNASFMSQPTVLGVQTLVILGPYLTNSGRFMDAWTLFGVTIRLAHSIGLHRNPSHLDHVLPLRECMIRQTLWWWMLHMDQQYSAMLEKPLGISGIGDCPPTIPLTTDQQVLRLEELSTRFTILARRTLSSDGMMSVGVIDTFTDQLLSLCEAVPETLQFKASWTRPETELPEWPLNLASASTYPPLCHNNNTTDTNERQPFSRKSKHMLYSSAAIASKTPCAPLLQLRHCATTVTPARKAPCHPRLILVA